MSVFRSFGKIFEARAVPVVAAFGAFSYSAPNLLSWLFDSSPTTIIWSMRALLVIYAALPAIVWAVLRKRQSGVEYPAPALMLGAAIGAVLLIGGGRDILAKRICDVANEEIAASNRAHPFRVICGGCTPRDVTWERYLQSLLGANR